MGHMFRAGQTALCFWLVATVGCDRSPEKNPPAAASPIPASSLESATPPARGRLLVSVQGGAVTAVAHSVSSPPPWPKGNCFTLYLLTPEQRDGIARTRNWGLLKTHEAHVANMHHENFSEIVKRLALQSVEVEVIAPGVCLIVDDRIGREWMNSQPCSGCVSKEAQELCGSTFAARFRAPLPTDRKE